MGSRSHKYPQSIILSKNMSHRYKLNTMLKGPCNLSLNTFHFTSIIQKAHGTYKRVLEGTDVGVCGLTLWKKQKNLEKTTNLGRAPTPCHMLIPPFKPAPQQWQASVLPLRYPGPCVI